MKSLTNYIKEAIDVENLQYKVNTWMASSQDDNERDSFNAVVTQYQSTHQMSDELVDKFMSHTNVRGFLDFMSDTVERDNFEDDRSTIIKIIQNL